VLSLSFFLAFTENTCPQRLFPWESSGVLVTSAHSKDKSADFLKQGNNGKMPPFCHFFPETPSLTNLLNTLTLQEVLESQPETHYTETWNKHPASKFLYSQWEGGKKSVIMTYEHTIYIQGTYIAKLGKKKG